MEQEMKPKKPSKPISGIYADAKQTMTQAIRNVNRAYRLPFFMVTGILTEILMEYKTEAMNEQSAEMEQYLEELENFHEAEKEELMKDLEELTRPETENSQEE